MVRNRLLPLLLLMGCNSSGGSVDGGPGDGAPPDAQPPPPMVQAFVLRMSADANIGVVGQAFTVTATPGGEVPDGVEFAWTGGDGVADGATYEVRFDEPGAHEVVVTATAGGAEVEEGVVLMVYPEERLPLGDVDGSGATAEADVALLRDFLASERTMTDAEEARADLDRNQELDEADLALLELLVAGESLRFVQPMAGSRGTAVQIAHPALLDPAGRLRFTFDDVEVPVTRGPPGYALIIVPLEADTAAAAEIALLDGDARIDSFPFDVLDPPDVQGDELPLALERLQGAVEVMPALVDAWLVDLEVSADDRALMTAMFQAVAEQLAEQRADFGGFWDQLTPEQQAIYTEVAVANGLDEAIAELDDISARMQAGVGQISTSRLIELVCLARDLSKVTKTIGKVNNIAGYVIDALWFLSFFIPPLAPVVAGLSQASAFIGAVMDAMQLLLEFVPRFGNLVILEPMPAELNLGEGTEIAASIKVQIAGGLCAGGAAVATKLILDKLKDRLFERIFGSVPGFGRIYRRARNQRTIIARLVNSIARFLGQIIDVVLEATGIEDRFKAMAAAVCDAIVPGQPWPIEPGALEWEANCGIINAGAWTCTEECRDRTVVVTARLDICGDTVSGRERVECARCAQSCPEGCCTAEGGCVAPEAQSEEMCGAPGVRCEACVDDQECRDGACQCRSTCGEDEVGAQRCADATTAETCEVVSEGCFRWTTKDCAAGGATCEEGMCVGGCGDWNCEGCCTAEHACTALDAQDESACGRGGSGCRGCAAGDECVGGICECRGPNCDPPVRAGSRGDPHLTTFDGLGYDFQGAGEFVLVEDPNAEGPDALMIQVRQVPLADPACRASATVNRAVAAQVGDARITFDPRRAQPFWVDGLAVRPPTDVAWPLGDGELWVSGSGRGTITWADGSLLQLRTGGAVDVGVSVAEGRAVVGLLGDGDGETDNDLRLRDGTVLPDPLPFELFYGAFADDWRVDEDSSLFDYAPGEGPEGWIVEGFPSVLADPASIDADRRASAEAICAELGIEDPTLLAACVLDVACTGDPGYAAGLLNLEPPADTRAVMPPAANDADRAQCVLESQDIPGELDDVVMHRCPAACIDIPCSVWGTDLYTDDSCICRAAIHAGAIRAGELAVVRVQHLEGLPSYVGSDRNGVSTSPWDDWSGSFQFPDAIPACGRTGADYLHFEPADGCTDGPWRCHDCPAGCAPAFVWGTDSYHERSSLCSAAAHAGGLDLEAGGRVFFRFPQFNGAYLGSARNGIESLDRDPHPVSIEFRVEP